MFRPRRGFTLIEIALVAALLGLVAAFGISKMRLAPYNPERELQQLVLQARGAAAGRGRCILRVEEGLLLGECVPSQDVLLSRKDQPWWQGEGTCTVYPDGSLEPWVVGFGRGGAPQFFGITPTGWIYKGKFLDDLGEKGLSGVD